MLKMGGAIESYMSWAGASEEDAGDRALWTKMAYYSIQYDVYLIFFEF